MKTYKTLLSGDVPSEIDFGVDVLRKSVYEILRATEMVGTRIGDDGTIISTIGWVGKLSDVYLNKIENQAMWHNENQLFKVGCFVITDQQVSNSTGRSTLYVKVGLSAIQWIHEQLSVHGSLPRQINTQLSAQMNVNLNRLAKSAAFIKAAK